MRGEILHCIRKGGSISEFNEYVNSVNTILHIFSLPYIYYTSNISSETTAKYSELEEVGFSLLKRMIALPLDEHECLAQFSRAHAKWLNVLRLLEIPKVRGVLKYIFYSTY